MSTKVWKGIVENIREGQKKAEIPISEAKGLMSGNLREALEELAEISAGLNLVEMVTPVNATEEKEKWLELARKGLFTDPVFQYNTDLLETVKSRGPRLEKLENEFKRVICELPREANGRIINKLVFSRRYETKTIIEAATALLRQDVNKLKEVMYTVYPAMPLLELTDIAGDEALRLAHKKEDSIVKKHEFALLGDYDCKKLRSMKIGPEEIRNYFWIVAKQYGIDQTRPIEVSSSAAAIDIRDKSSVGPIVVVPSDREPVDGLKLLELIAHEIEGHWRASENTQTILPLIGGGALKPADETLYEGHAMLIEHQAKYMLEGVKKGMAKPWALSTIGLALAEYSFSEAATHLYPLMQAAGQEPGEDELEVRVWKVCSRIYRGLTDTSKNPRGYAFTKDQAYFSGRMLAEDLFDAGLEHLLEFSTLSIRDLETLSQVFKIKPTDVKYRRRVDVLTNIAGMLLAHCD